MIAAGPHTTGRARARLVVVVAALLAVLAGASPAGALTPAPPQGFVRALSDARQLKNADPARRAAALQAAAAAGATVVRLPVGWRDLMVGAVDWSSPAAADPANPAYDFTHIDDAVRSASETGLTPLLMLFRAPDSALADPIWPFAHQGTWAPQPAAIAAFATALALRYSGTFPDPTQPGLTLPRVRLWQAWNEPNLANYLEPQWVARGPVWGPFSPTWYRRMLNAFTAAVKAVDPGNTVAAAGIAPSGNPIDGDGRMTPLRFLHAFLCLRPPPSLQPDPTCDDPPRFDALALHPLSTGDPDRPARSQMDVAIADIRKVTEPLDAAARAGWLGPAPHTRLWITELNWETGAAPERVPASRQYAYVARGLERLWRAGAELITWHFLADPPTLLHGRKRPAGLLGVLPDGGLGAPKRVLRGFRFPLVVRRLDDATVHVWAAPPPGSGPLTLQYSSGRGMRPIATWPARAIVDEDIGLRRGGRLRMSSGGDHSAIVAVPAP